MGMRELKIRRGNSSQRRRGIIKLSDSPDLGLWATPDLKRVAVSLRWDTPEPVIGYILEVGKCEWVAEGDPATWKFATPRKAAEHGYAILWGPSASRQTPGTQRRIAQ
jgi:hypothetical protein